MQVLETDRLVLRWLCLDDALFILELLNDEGWLRYIGDKGVRNMEDACKYLQNGPIAMYARCGHGLYMVERKCDALPIGMCGLIKRDGLADVDIGFAFLPQYGGMGYARESAAAVLEYGRATLGMKRVVAITSPDNVRSIKVLEAVGLEFEKKVKMSPGEPALLLLACEFA